MSRSAPRHPPARRRNCRPPTVPRRRRSCRPADSGERLGPPTTASPPNRRRHRASLMTATGGEPGLSSVSTSRRPWVARMPSSDRYPPDDLPPSDRSGCRHETEGREIDRPEPRASSCARDSRRSRDPRSAAARAPGRRCSATTRTTRSESREASGRSSTAFIRLKTVVFAPMPTASIVTATIVKPGDLRRCRRDPQVLPVAGPIQPWPGLSVATGGA